MDQPERRPVGPTTEPERRPPPGEAGVALFGLAIGIMLMSMQLWLLTLAFDLYMYDDETGALLAAAFSGLVFLGGLLMLRFLGRRPRRRE